ncbi:MAG: S8 family serine peptidase, partial [Chloroflexota bacterium]
APAYRVLPQWRSLAGNAIPAAVLLYRGADTSAAVRQLQQLGGRLTSRAILNQTWEVVGMTLAGRHFHAAAHVPGVYSIQPRPAVGGLRGEMSSQVNVNQVDVYQQAYPGYQAWLNEVGLDGAGVVIANVDSGVQSSHPDLANRLLTCVGDTCSSTSSSHGTHTAGIMAADGSSGALDSYGFLRGLGVAPGASLIEQLYSPTYYQADGMLTLMRESYNNGALLSGNSWGPSSYPLGYDNDTLQVDIGVRDADAYTPGAQSLSFVLSVMNGYGGTSTQGTPDEAKNIFTIGSTKMQTWSGQQILEIDDLSTNTAHGPALDGRTIPHLVAPGCYVDSTTLTSSWTLTCGTSMASPQVSGAIALFIQYYRSTGEAIGGERFYAPGTSMPVASPLQPVDPSPALIKAAFLPVAHDLAGHLDADNGVLGHPFDSKQGWGRLDVAAVVDPQTSVLYFDNPTILDNTGEEWTQTLTAADSSQPLKLMLVWTDAPGHGLGGSTPAWNNDLDLVVEVDGASYLGNNFGSDGWSTTGGSADYRHNTEGVFLGPTFAGSVTVRVVAANLNSDGVPESGDSTDQDFALVCYNCASSSDYTLDVTPISQDVCAPTEVVYEVTVGSLMGFTAPVTLSASGQPAGTIATFTTNPLTPPAKTNLTVSNTASAIPGDYTLLVNGTANGLVHQAAVTLHLATDMPASPALLSPADGASEVELMPTFTWAAADQATTYDLEIASDPAFSDLLYTAAGLSDTTHTAAITLSSGMAHYWRVWARNVCGVSAAANVFTFTTQVVASTLLVDDDDNNPDVQATYTAALDVLAITYDLWDTGNSDDEPTASDLAPYSAVIWFSGDEYGGAAGPGESGEVALADWLDSGGKCLFLSSQDYYYDRDLTSFMSDYLGISSVNNDRNYTAVRGRNLFNGLGPYTLSYPFNNYSDKLTPDATATVAFRSTKGTAAVSKETATYLTAFLGFPWEALPTAADEQAILDRFLSNCP